MKNNLSKPRMHAAINYKEFGRKQTVGASNCKLLHHLLCLEGSLYKLFNS